MGDGGHTRARLAARCDTRSHITAVVSAEKVVPLVAHLQEVVATSPAAWASMQRYINLDRQRSANGGQRSESPQGRHLVDVPGAPYDISPGSQAKAPLVRSFSIHREVNRNGQRARR